MTKPTQHFGCTLIAEGYQTDNEGKALESGVIYNVTKEGEAVKTIYRVGIVGKRVNKPIKRKAASHGA